MRSVFLFLVLGLAVVPAVACAHSRGSYDVHLECEGEPCAEVSQRGTRWVVGEYGDRYAIVVTNRTDRWTEAVVTVDGRDVLNGSPGSYSNRGYLIEPYGRIEIEGWRTSSQDVAAFRFTTVPDSYAGRVDGGQNVGVVGVALFPEKRRPRPVYRTPPPQPWPEQPWGAHDRSGGESAEAAPSSKAETGSARRHDAPRERQGLGTRYGERRWSSVTEVDFERNSSSPATVLTLRYDDRSGLLARGIRAPEPRYVPPPPSYNPPHRYVPPPPDPFPTW
jgi:hypothetical protein